MTMEDLRRWDDPNLRARYELAREDARRYSIDALRLAPRHREHPPVRHGDLRRQHDVGRIGARRRTDRRGGCVSRHRVSCARVRRPARRRRHRHRRPLASRRRSAEARRSRRRCRLRRSDVGDEPGATSRVRARPPRRFDGARRRRCSVRPGRSGRVGQLGQVGQSTRFQAHTPGSPARPPGLRGLPDLYGFAARSLRMPRSQRS
jgi:hypothetical protein